MTRTPAKQALIDRLGARPVVADGLDPEAVAQAVAEAEPEVVVNQLTAIDTTKFSRSIDKMFTLTNRLRTEGTDHLLAAARAVGARRFVAQSFAGWPYEPTGGPVKSEDDPLQASPPKTVSQGLRRHPACRGGGYRGRGHRRAGPALRRVLRPRDLDRPQSRRRAGHDAAQGPPAHHRRRRRDLVDGPHRGRGGRRRRQRSSVARRASTTSPTTSPLRSR